MSPNFKRGFQDWLALGVVCFVVVALVVLSVYGLVDCIDKHGWFLCLK